MRVAPDRLDHSEQVGVALSQNPVTAATASTVTLYSADGLIAVQEEHDGVVADVPQAVCNSAGDDDLTSLTWLQDKNLLKKGVPELPKHEFIDGNVSDPTHSNSSASGSSSHKATLNHNINVIPRVSYDPQVHVTSKPPFSFSCLIFMAIEDSDDKALPVKDIYVWILNHFPYYRNAPTGWKNSVRHNLSLNKCFKKVDKSPNLGKGSLWMVEQRFRPCLIQALQKTPYHQYQKFIRNSSNNNNNNNYNNSNNNNSSSNKKMATESDTCDSKDGIFAEGEANATATSFQNGFTNTIASFPSISLKEHLTDDVDAAATAMLVLKHGACAFDIKAENVDFVLSENSRTRSRTQTPLEEKADLASCPNDDHNYGYHHYNSNRVNSALVAGSPADEKMNSSYWNSVKEEMEERRKIVEGADALLNLAGITTYNTRKRSLSILEEQQNVKQSCSESLAEFEQRLKPSRKDRTSVDNYKESINVYRHSSDGDGNEREEEGDDSDSSSKARNSNISSHEERPRSQKNRATVSNRRLRRKIEKKRFKL